MAAKFQNLPIQIALGLSAASALIYEVVSTNILFFYFIKSSYSIATVLSVFLLGLGIGSLIIYKSSEKIKNKKTLFGILQILVAVYSFFILANLTDIAPALSTLGVFIASFVILLIPTIFLGAVFPLAGSIFIKKKKEIMGLVYSLDLFGAIAGTIIAGFILIPLLGNRIAILFGAAFNLLSAIIIFPKKKKLIPIALLIILLPLSITLPNLILKNNSEKTGSEIEFYANSPYGVIEFRNSHLFIGGRSQCALSYPENSSARIMVHFALEPFNRQDLKVLNIGLGCGQTLARILEMVNTTVDIVEINPVIVSENRVFSNVLKDKRVYLKIADGLTYLRRTHKTYDSILIDIENPTIAHASNLYTVEAFRIISSSLTKEGTFALWTYNIENKRYYDILYYSLKESFPFVYQYDPEVMIASKKQLDKEEYIPSTQYEINTIDRNTLTQVYLEEAK